MSKNKLTPETRKIKFSITVNPILFNQINQLEPNKSKYIERLIYNDLINNNLINKDLIL